MKDGTKQTDALEQVWVAYNDQDELALRELVARFCSMILHKRTRIDVPRVYRLGHRVDPAVRGER